MSQPEDHVPLMKHRGPIAHVDVFVDNFIGLAQGSQHRCKNVRCCIMHAVDDIFSQPDLAMAQRKEAISTKKLLKGEGGWSQRKEILGWILDTYQGTLELTDWQKACILAIFEDLNTKSELVSRKGSGCLANSASWDQPSRGPPVSLGPSSWDSLMLTSITCRSLPTFRPT